MSDTTVLESIREAARTGVEDLDLFLPGIATDGVTPLKGLLFSTSSAIPNQRLAAYNPIRGKLPMVIPTGRFV